MVIHGKERNFLLTVGASAEIAELCPDGDITRLGELLTQNNSGKQLRSIAKVIAALSRGYESSRKYEEPGYEPSPLTADEILTLTMEELTQLRDEAFDKFVQDSKPTVEVEPSKKNSKK